MKIILALLGIVMTAACTPTQEEALIDAATKVSSEIDDALVNAPQLAFAGKVTSIDGGRWLNDYLVIVYKDGEEVGRSTSQLGEFPESGEGKHDGLFFVKIDNLYDLTAADLITPALELAFQDAQGVVGVKYIYTWLNEVPPGYRFNVAVPSKRIGYSLIILPVPTTELPADLLDGPTTLTSGDMILASNGTAFDLNTAVPTPVPVATTAPAPITTNGVNWTRTVTGFSGNRWQAWQQYVENQVSGITWDQFKDDVLIYNPDLEADGYVFQAGKQYILPQN
ncbi:MAG: hypothetical protein H6667_11530 [Ardenticatenaceae bacterium]|nr:hypothetical protein [Ardenticatenaceae bacterium]